MCDDSLVINTFINHMRSCHFIPLITEPTKFPTSNSYYPSLLDHIWVNNISIFQTGIILNDITDHCPMLIRYPINKPRSQTKTKITFRYDCDENRNSFKNAMESFDWRNLKTSNVGWLLCFELHHCIESFVLYCISSEN